MYSYPKIILGLLAILLVAFVFLAARPKKSTFQITSAQNKFSLQTKLSKKDQKTAEAAFTSLGLGQLNSDVQFQLDSTSSSALAFATPIDGKINFDKGQVSISGTVSKASKDFSQSIKIPPDTTFAVYSSNLSYFESNNLNLAESVVNWHISQKAQGGSMFAVIFGANSEWATAVKNAGPVNTEELKGLVDQNELKTKQYESTELNLLKTTKNAEEIHFVIFEKGGFTYIASSEEAATTIINNQSAKDNSIFPDTGTLPASFVLLYKNTQKDLPSNFANLVFGASSQKATFLTQVAQIKFALKQSSFSGLIKLK